MIKNINTFIFGVFPTMNFIEKLTVILGVLVICHAMLIYSIWVLKKIRRWCSTDPNANKINPTHINCCGWAVIIIGVGCWFTGSFGITAVLIVIGVLFLLAGSTL